MAGAKPKILALFEKNVGKPLSKEKIAKEAGIFDWARVVRTLRQEGYDIKLLADGSYVMGSTKKSKSGKSRGYIDLKTRYRILQRDNSTCQRCGRKPEDGVRLRVDHKIPVELGGETVDDNLWVLCEDCNSGKKHWFADNTEEMKGLFKEKSGKKRLEIYLEMHPNQFLGVSKLSIVSGIRDWERTLRSIREKTGKRIVYIKKDPLNSDGEEGYVYKK